MSALKLKFSKARSAFEIKEFLETHYQGDGALLELIGAQKELSKVETYWVSKYVQGSVDPLATGRAFLANLTHEQIFAIIGFLSASEMKIALSVYGVRFEWEDLDKIASSTYGANKMIVACHRLSDAGLLEIILDNSNVNVMQAAVVAANSTRKVAVAYSLRIADAGVLDEVLAKFGADVIDEMVAAGSGAGMKYVLEGKATSSFTRFEVQQMMAGHKQSKWREALLELDDLPPRILGEIICGDNVKLSNQAIAHAMAPMRSILEVSALRSIGWESMARCPAEKLLDMGVCTLLGILDAQGSRGSREGHSLDLFVEIVGLAVFDEIDRLNLGDKEGLNLVFSLAGAYPGSVRSLLESCSHIRK